MNTNLFQTILTTAGLILAGVATVLIHMGCTTLPDGSLSCAVNSAPIWLAPYMVSIASLLGIAKLIIGYLTGKLAAPTAIISDSGKAGTVTPAQVAVDNSK